MSGAPCPGLPLAEPLPPDEAAVVDPPDPYLWLEGVDDPRALAQVRVWNDATLGALGAVPGFDDLRARLLAALDSDARLPLVERIGGWFYNFWRDAARPRGVWRRTSPAAYRGEAPRWEVVLDLDALAAAEGEPWVWVGADMLAPDDARCLISLSRGGADARVVREFDLGRGAFVEGGFVLPEAKSRVSWAGPDALLVGTDFGPGSRTDSGYPREVRRWRRGTPLAEAEPVFAGTTDDVAVTGWREQTPGFEREWVSRARTFFTSELYLVGPEGPVRVDKPDSAQATPHREWLLLSLREDWAVDGQVLPAGALVATRLDAILAGEPRFEVLFAPTPERSLAGFVPTPGRVVLNVLDRVRSRLEARVPGPGGWSAAPVEGLPELGAITAWAVAPETDDDLFLVVTDHLTPPSLLLLRPGQPPEPLKRGPAFFAAAGLTKRQLEATSADGTRVPFFLVGPERLRTDGGHPTLLYGYGGFEIPLVPAYSPGVGLGWLERGGVFVVANIRGGGEFGPRWHQAARREHRVRAYQDFAAVAEALVALGVTTPARLGIQGGSNGGLLVGNMVVGWPERFAAAVCQVPLLDMRRYTKLLAGASWIGEYGDPDDPADWAFLQRYSPYHRVGPGGAGPRVLFLTSTRDDRVHPAHARKMAARMRALGHDVWFYENVEGGHGAAADNRQAALLSALAFTFLWETLGGDPPPG